MDISRRPPDLIPPPDLEPPDVTTTEAGTLPQLDLETLGRPGDSSIGVDTRGTRADITAPPDRRPAQAGRFSGATAMEQTTSLAADAAGEPRPDQGDTAQHSDQTPAESGQATQETDPPVESETNTAPPGDTGDGTDPPNDLPPVDGLSGDDYDGDWTGGTPPESQRNDLYHKLHPVGRYTAKDRSAELLEPGKSVRIPTSLTERTTFTKGSPEWNTNNTASEYREVIFDDASPGIHPDCANIAGGEAEAFAEGKRVLDVGSGEAVALLQFSEEHPGTTFIGIDQGYKETRDIDLDKPGVQLTKDDWHSLDQIPTGSIDTLISQRGVIPWGIGPGDPGSPQVADALTRVAKPGAVWRVDTGPHPDVREYLTSLMEQRGWEARPVYTKGGTLSWTLVFIKGT